MFKTERVMRVQSCCFADLKQLFTEVEVVSDGKYPPLAADTEVNNCFSIYESGEIIEHKIKMMIFKSSFTAANDKIWHANVMFPCRQITLFKAFV